MPIRGQEFFRQRFARDSAALSFKTIVTRCKIIRYKPGLSLARISGLSL